MGRSVYKNACIGGEIVDLITEDGRFSFIGKVDGEGMDLGGLDVFPGLVDIHCHGAMGYDAFSPDRSGLEAMNVYFASRGITTWYPTTGGSLETVRSLLGTSLSGLRGGSMPGYHLEGPYLSPLAAGACAVETMKCPDPEDFRGFDNVKLITVAPELEGAMEYIRSCDARVCIGHTRADYGTALLAIDAGASCLTHTFNAMPPFHHREPGVIGAAIDRNIYVQVIADGVHLHRSVVTALYRIFGRERMILISDAVSGTGLPDGEYLKQGKYRRIIRDGAIRTEQGNLAGSASDLLRDIQVAISMGIPREDVFYMASTTPADYMGINKGHIAVGYDADFIVVDRENRLIRTVIGGEIFEA